MKKLFSIALVATLLGLLAASPAYAIKKCKDSEGRWHYGDQAVRSCEQSKVTTLTDRGFIKSEKSAPKTEAELKAEEEANASFGEEEKRLKAEQDERNRILSVYETEADIDRQRDNQLDSIESNIAVHKAYLKSMQAKIVRTNESMQGAKGKRKEKLEASLSNSQSEVKEFTARLEDLVKQKDQITKKFAIEKGIYRTLKGES
jgi:hypothetical protein